MGQVVPGKNGADHFAVECDCHTVGYFVAAVGIQRELDERVAIVAIR